jgi:hypothetical protein
LETQKSARSFSAFHILPFKFSSQQKFSLQIIEELDIKKEEKMEKMGALRTIYRAACLGSSRSAAISQSQLRHHLASRSLFTVSAPSVSTTPKRIPCGTSFCLLF